MALKDIGVGYGVLSGHVDKWHCPNCKKASAITDWKAERTERGLDARRCPNAGCSFVASQVGDTQRMVNQEILASLDVLNMNKAKDKKHGPVAHG